MNTLARSERTKVKRLPARGAYDQETIYSILDDGFICHVGFAIDGQPYVIPTGYARIGDHVYIHGSSASRMLRSLAEGIDVCVTVTHVDGLVLARSAFHHSINYRSVVVLGQAKMVEDPAEKEMALEAFTEHIIPGRWPEIRWPSELELKATTVLKLAIDEASAKVRTGDPKDDDEDYGMNVWAGVVPLSSKPGQPIRDSRLADEIDLPTYISEYLRK
ncbi:MAG: pyridoxamine 5'-phosphate oxidase family protein [Blastocatellia bacterium]|nr:pyridoxamine 5'-phosphate oxidase family protein [Chloracidobacterium sp.]MBL8185226.1 pyridoxamine 5'-phosphate oxidase family protein [Blastocatellia bacterium]HRJ88104.1 pyridoxamine 5'-phosphate oxidase family protein [Pyrinomonadaceae bacterium]